MDTVRRFFCALSSLRDDVLSSFHFELIENGSILPWSACFSIRGCVKLPPEVAFTQPLKEEICTAKHIPLFKGDVNEGEGVGRSLEVGLTVQGDTSGCSPGFVDIKAKVAFQYKDHILKLNFCFDVN